MADLAQLDNPVWNSLRSGHRHMALANGLARRYPPEISSLVGLEVASPAAFDDLRAMVADGETVGLVSPEAVAIPDGWDVRRARYIDQMVAEHLDSPAVALDFLPLGEADVDEMLALAAATEPGPFAPGTYRMGRFQGLRDGDGRLMAMTGERMHLAGLTEVSAVCTWPEFRGRGLAGALVIAATARILAEGRMAFLHVKGENAAKQLYERIGYRTRRAVHYTVMTARRA